VSYIIIASRGLTLAERYRGSGRRLNDARNLFRIFHRFPAATLIRMPCRRVVPKMLVHLGHLRGLIYSSDKGTQGCRRTYIHFMDRPPRLTCNPEGTQLYIIGGRYRITPRGIEG
jgi:hypothetical protein